MRVINNLFCGLDTNEFNKISSCDRSKSFLNDNIIHENQVRKQK